MCDKCGKDYACMCMEKININPNLLSRTELYELGRRGPYYRFIDFPVKLSELSLETSWDVIVGAEKLGGFDDILEFGRKSMEEVLERKCNCDIMSLMREGCKCGGK